ncbi:MAG: glycosyl transferase [Candidatus Hydrogenedentota bacterium]|nr:MAG: glycosyl transferase [Candidatus Hydrogenedentota bacterium]
MNKPISQDNKTLSIVVPIYNEAATIEEIVRRILASDIGPIKKEIILVDDGSTDGSQEIATQMAAQHSNITTVLHEKNLGKGAALQNGFNHCTGDWVIIQDADLEYDPSEYPTMLEPVLAGRADVVYGSRFVTNRPRRVVYYWHSLGNKILTTFSNICCDINLTDMETCYKLFSREILSGITLKEKRFGIEPELTAKIAKTKCRIYEVGISYYGRTYDEGKKIGWKDGVRAFYCIIKYNFFD